MTTYHLLCDACPSGYDFKNFLDRQSHIDMHMSTDGENYVVQNMGFSIWLRYTGPTMTEEEIAAFEANRPIYPEEEQDTDD